MLSKFGADSTSHEKNDIDTDDNEKDDNSEDSKDSEKDKLNEKIDNDDDDNNNDNDNGDWTSDNAYNADENGDAEENDVKVNIVETDIQEEMMSEFLPQIDTSKFCVESKNQSQIDTDKLQAVANALYQSGLTHNEQIILTRFFLNLWRWYIFKIFIYSSISE